MSKLNNTVPCLEARMRELEEQLQRAKDAQDHTQRWYAQHYGKLQDWARTRLPEQWRNEFFFCIANGLWGFADVGEPYICKGGGTVTPSNYFPLDTAEGQMILDQTKRAEAAEVDLAQLRQANETLEAGIKTSIEVLESIANQTATAGADYGMPAISEQARGAAQTMKVVLECRQKGYYAELADGFKRLQDMYRRVVTRLTIAKIEIKDNLQEWHSVQDGQVNRREIEERIGKLNRVLNTLCMPFPPLADSGEKEARS